LVEHRITRLARPTRCWPRTLRSHIFVRSFSFRQSQLSLVMLLFGESGLDEEASLLVKKMDYPPKVKLARLGFCNFVDTPGNRTSSQSSRSYPYNKILFGSCCINPVFFHFISTPLPKTLRARTSNFLESLSDCIREVAQLQL